MAENTAELLEARSRDARPALSLADGAGGVRTVSWAQTVADTRAWSRAVGTALAGAEPAHVGLLLGNSAPMVLALLSAAWGRHVAVGLNATRRGPALAADVRRAECRLVLTDAEHAPLLDGLDLAGAEVMRVDSPEWAECLERARDEAAREAGDRTGEPDPRRRRPDEPVMMVFTSGTSGEPKAVRVTEAAVCSSGELIAGTFGLGGRDVVYLAMPLFHSNAILAGMATALAAGAAMVPAGRFSAGGFLADVRTHGVTYFPYVGKPLSYVLDTPPRPDDAETTLRLAFGNEATPRDVEEFARRFGCVVVDGYGSTELGVAIRRDATSPPGSIGKPAPGVQIRDPETGRRCPPAEFDDSGAVTNPDECVGEIVNTAGAGMFGGYHGDPEATAERLRGGMYWSGDLAYADSDSEIFLVGRTGSWVRVDGENMATGIVERILLRDPGLARVAVYGVPDPRGVGDQLVAAVVPRAGVRPEAAALRGFLESQADLSPRAWPRWVRVCEELPMTATNKIVTRQLAAQDLHAGADQVWERGERGRDYRRIDDRGCSPGAPPPRHP